MLLVGIDPGTHTGVAVWDPGARRFLALETLYIHEALQKVLDLNTLTDGGVEVYMEDARLRKWYGRGDTSAKLQGAGSVKRDCSIWEDFCEDMRIAFHPLAPIEGATKTTPSYFKLITGWPYRTSEHSRDAAMLVLGR